MLQYRNAAAAVKNEVPAAIAILAIEFTKEPMKLTGVHMQIVIDCLSSPDNATLFVNLSKLPEMNQGSGRIPEEPLGRSAGCRARRTGGLLPRAAIFMPETPPCLQQQWPICRSKLPTLRNRTKDEFGNERCRLRQELDKHSENQVGILAVIGHWATPDFEKKEALLEFTEIRGRSYFFGSFSSLFLCAGPLVVLAREGFQHPNTNSFTTTTTLLFYFLLLGN